MGEVWIVPIRRLLSMGENEVGDILYHDHSLLRIVKVCKSKGNILRYKFRVIGKVNLDRQFRKQPAGTPTKED